MRWVKSHAFRRTLIYGAFAGLLALDCAASAQADENKGPPTPCDKELSIKAAEGILVGTPTVNHYSMSASKHEEGCEIGVAASSGGFAMIDFSIRSADRQFFDNILMMAGAKRKRLSGIGDEAYGYPSMGSNIPNATETDVYAIKGKQVCMVELHHANAAAQLVIPKTDDDINQKLGALCQKVFVARGS